MGENSKLQAPSSREIPSSQAQEEPPTGVSALSERFALRNTDGFWELTCGGHTAVLKQDQGLFYVAWLLANLPAEPLAAIELAEKVYDEFCLHPDFRQNLPWVASHGGSEHLAKVLVRQQRALEAILDSEDELDPVKTEALNELIVLAERQAVLYEESARDAQATGDILARGLRSLRLSLAAAADVQGNPQTLSQAFARHLLLCLFLPSIRAAGPDGVARYVYRPAK